MKQIPNFKIDFHNHYNFSKQEKKTIIDPAFCFMGWPCLSQGLYQLTSSNLKHCV